MKHNQKGFTLIELLIVVAIVAIVAIVIGVWGTLAMGNMWYTEKGVLEELKLDHPNITEVLDTNRNAWGYSQIIVQEGEKINTYYLNSDFLWNYEFHK